MPILTQDAPDAYSAFPSVTEGSLLANPGRDGSMDELSRIVNVATRGGSGNKMGLYPTGCHAASMTGRFAPGNR